MNQKNPFKALYQQLMTDRSGTQGVVSIPENLDRQRLEALYLVSQQLNKILDPDLLFEMVIKKIAELMQAERAVIVMREKGDDLRIKISHNSDEQSEQNALHFSRSVVTNVLDNYQPLFSTNALDDSRFSTYQTIQKLEILSFICVPLRVDKEIIGTIYVDNRHLTNVFTEADVEFLQAFANLLGIAIRNSMAYNEVEELNRTLEARVKKRTTKLQKTIKELKDTQERLIQSEKMAGLGRLIAGFLHEFNNPINFIYSNLPHLEQYSYDLMEALEGALSELSEVERKQIEEEKDLNFIKKDLMKLLDGFNEGIRRSRQLVEDLKNFSRGGSLQYEQIDWNANLDDVIKRFKKKVSEPPQVECKFEGDIKVKGSRLELNQALMNILQNAAEAGATRIKIDSEKDKEWLRCNIRDNGSGISQSNISKIFDPFYTSKEVGKGMGLGLSIAYGTISHHNGEMEVSSEPGQGTMFSIKLPLER